MSERNLCRRLSVCAEFVAAGSRLADIGTDHAYLPIYLTQKGVITRAVACDIAEGPLHSAEENIRSHHLTDRIESRLSDGLQNISEGEADTIVIAGMGGELIVRILSDCEYIRDSSLSLILQPMTRYEKLISWLCQNGFALNAQRTAREGSKLYTVIHASYTGETKPADPLYSFVGKLNPEIRDDRDFLLFTLKRMKKQAIGDRKYQEAARLLEEYLA